ncbi:stage III sporulation protein AH [Piscibacillus sp. B03]|uniref:stage III sporulation protein AH n=1 Tax=Piscibacillus sp. B03 TaxID=3457430 RepID=UPI003FCE1980
MDIAFETCDQFYFVLRKDLGPLDGFSSLLDKLSNSLIEKREQSEWAGTVLGDNNTAEVYYYHTDQNAKKIIKESARSLYSWVYPNLPEDLCFLKSGRDWLVTISHESEGFIKDENEEETSKISNISGLKVRKV